MLVRILRLLQRYPGQVRTCFFLCLGLIAFAGLFVSPREPHFFGDTLPLFWTAFGFGGCMGLALVCKGLSKKFLAREEGYYKSNYRQGRESPPLATRLPE